MVVFRTAQKAELWYSSTAAYPSYGQLLTNTLNPGGTEYSLTPGNQPGPEVAKSSTGINLGYNDYPRIEGQVTYIKCDTPGGFYVVYLDPAAGSGVAKEIPIGSPTPIIYGSGPYCL